MMNHRQTLRLYAEWCDLADLRQGDRYLIVNPFFHIFGYKAGCIASLIRGATILPVAVFESTRCWNWLNAKGLRCCPGRRRCTTRCWRPRASATCRRCGRR